MPCEMDPCLSRSVAERSANELARGPETTDRLLDGIGGLPSRIGGGSCCDLACRDMAGLVYVGGCIERMVGLECAEPESVADIVGNEAFRDCAIHFSRACSS